MESTAKLSMLFLVIVFCVGAVVPRSIHRRQHHHSHHDKRGSQGHFRSRHPGGHLGGVGRLDMDQGIRDVEDPRSLGGLGGADHPVAKRHSKEELTFDVKELQNCAVCNYSVTLVPKSDVYDVPEDLVEITCNPGSVGKSCSDTGLDYICMQAFTWVKFGVKENPGEFRKLRINTGCVCALRVIEELESKEPKHTWY